MRTLLMAALVFVVIAVSVLIGGAMIAKTFNVTYGLATVADGYLVNESVHTGQGELLVNTMHTDTGNSLSTLTSLLPIVALAAVGGIAIAYLLGYFGQKVQ